MANLRGAKQPRKLFVYLGLVISTIALTYITSSGRDEHQIEWRHRVQPNATSVPKHSSSVFGLMQSLGFAPTYIIDVGANEGKWAKYIWREFGHLKPTVLMIEGSSNRSAALEKTGFSYTIAVVGASNKRVHFFERDASNTGNSVLQENTVYFKNVKPMTVQMHTLDNLLKLFPCTFTDKDSILLKLDVQGYELEALKGSRNTLKHVDFVVMETSIVPWNKGSPLLPEVVLFMDKIGFQIFDMIEVHRFGGGILIQLDFVFTKKNSAYVANSQLRAGVLRQDANM